MTAYDSVALGAASGTFVGTWTGAAVASAALGVQGGVDPSYARGGSAALTVAVVPWAGSFDGHGPVVAGIGFAALSSAILGRLDATGASLVGVALTVSAFYRTGDRLTLAGYARDLAGNPLRAFEVQFVGQSVQQHFFGSSTDLDGIYVAFLDQGDTYTAFAFSPTSGVTFRLERMDTTPNQTNLTFRQVTKRGGSGEGLFRQGA
jgi:hypothetical protein